MSNSRQSSADFARNRLDEALSPYLRSHSGNPVHWQQWDEEVLRYAREHDLILLVSVGYSTCHWCHVMAADSFSDPACAGYLNRHFMPIKVDREERPDIDQYMMGFLVSTTGTGGWPLNVFLAPDLRPFYAMTYAAPQPRFGRPGFLDILRRVKRFYDEKKTVLQPMPPHFASPASDALDDEQQLASIDSAVSQRADLRGGGFIGQQKFPPHCSLLYALYRIASGAREQLQPFVRSTLDAMMGRGLHDHLQGGFFRYCVDSDWTVPHFEKMLYDQALLLWNYALAARLFDSPAYEATARGIVDCLQQTFLDDGLLCAAHDADTDHHEGATYLWTAEQIRELLTPREFAAFEKAFELPAHGNFEGLIHLLRRRPTVPAADLETAASGETAVALAAARRTLLRVRQSRPQPFRDSKKLTSWNALAAIGLLHAARHLRDEATATSARRMASGLRDALVRRHLGDDGSVLHGTIDGNALGGRFLEDHAAMLLLLTFSYEEQRSDAALIGRLVAGLDRFRDQDGWITANENDFFKVPADSFDSPSPSPLALAEFARARAAMVLGREYPQVGFGAPAAGDFLSLAALHTRGYVYTIQAPGPLAWSELPINSVQVDGSPLNHCIHGVCRPGLPEA